MAKINFKIKQLSCWLFRRWRPFKQWNLFRQWCQSKKMSTALIIPLVICAILLQTLILIRMQSDDTSEVSITNGSGVLFRPERTLDTLKRINIFDSQRCDCGLHFQVDRTHSQLYPTRAAANNRFLTIGIPTVRRKSENYLVQTVSSLLKNMNAAQRNEVVIVILIADQEAEDQNYTFQNLKRNFSESIAAGQIQIIIPPSNFYDNFKVTKQTYSQPFNYVQWRSKQNFDYAYLMRYSIPLSMYYLQLEDDVLAAKDYVASIQQYIDQQKDSWTCLEFSELGFIGKLYRSKDLMALSQLLLIFYQEQPVDYTYLYFNMLMTQLQKRIRMPTLFQHQGINSSFPGKIQPLKDRFFDNMEKLYKGDNPPAEIYTTLKTYLNFLPKLPYSITEGYFWTSGSPSVGDTYIIAFEKPQQVERVIVETGSVSHPKDILEKASLKASLTLLHNPSRLECENDVHLGDFSEGRVDVKNISSLVKFKIMCLQIEVLKEQHSWAIIREIAVFLVKQS